MRTALEEKEKELSALTVSHRDLEAQLKKRSAELVALTEERTSANNALIDMESDKLHASAECSQLEEVLADARREIADLRATVAALETDKKQATVDLTCLRLTNEDLLVSLRWAACPHIHFSIGC